MPSLNQIFEAIKLSKNDLLADKKHLAQNSVFRHACAVMVAGGFLALVPALAYAGIWNGGLCHGYQQIMDNEMAEIVSLGAAAGGIIAWLMDDGKSEIKTVALRVGAGTITLLNAPIIWAALFNHGSMACAGA